MTLIFSLALMLRRRERHAEHRLDQRGQPRLALAQRRERGASVAVERHAQAVEQRARPLGDVEAGAPAAQPLEQRRQLQQRVVAEMPGIEAWPGGAVGGHA